MKRIGFAGRNRQDALVARLWCCLLLIFSAFDASANIRWWGEVGYNFRSEYNEDSADLQEHTPVLRLHASSYLYRPWLATIEGGVQMQATRTDLDAGDSRSDSVSGDVMLRLFPQSYFPLELFAERANTDSDSELSGLRLDRTRYGFLQRYVTPSGTALRMGYEHTDLTNRHDSAAADEEKRTDIGDFFHGSAQKSFNHHNLNFDTNYNRIDTLDSPQRTKTSFTSLRHAYRPGPRLFAEDLLTYNTSDREQEFGAFDSSILQLTSYAFWRPEPDSRLRLNANFRALTRDNNPRLGPQVTSNSANTSLFANYELDDQWLFTGGFGATGLDVEGDKSTTSFQTLRATYNSDSWYIKGVETGWFARLEAGNDTDDGDAVQRVGAQIGYSLDRNWMLGSGSSRAELSQSISQNKDTDDFSATRLITDASLMWSMHKARNSTVARVSISDSRTYAQGEDIRGVEGDFQIVNAQLSVNHRFSAAAYLSGNVTLQTIREYRPAMRGISGAENGEWRPTATIDLSFFNRSIFGVNRLDYRSTLRFISDAFVPVLMDPETLDGRENSFWENRFDYMIGRMQLRFIARLNNVNDNRRILTLFQIRRLIGDS